MTRFTKGGPHANCRLASCLVSLQSSQKICVRLCITESVRFLQDTICIGLAQFHLVSQRVDEAIERAYSLNRFFFWILAPPVTARTNSVQHSSDARPSNGIDELFSPFGLSMNHPRQFRCTNLFGLRINNNGRWTQFNRNVQKSTWFEPQSCFAMHWSRESFFWMRTFFRIPLESAEKTVGVHLRMRFCRISQDFCDRISIFKLLGAFLDLSLKWDCFDKWPMLKTFKLKVQISNRRRSSLKQFARQKLRQNLIV